MVKRTTKTKEEWKTYKDVFDNFTLRTIFKLESEGHFKEPLRPISIGKESNVFYAQAQGKRVAIKVYRLQTSNFNKMIEYIRTDPRFPHIRKQKRDIIFAWTQREYRNLLIAREAGVSCPKPIAFRNNVLVLEYIGDENPAVKLKDYHPTEDILKKVLENIKKLHKAGYVHSDLSPYNILINNEKPVLIDWSHCTPLTCPNSKEYLVRDMKIIVKFFEKHEIEAPNDVFDFI